MGGCLGGGSPAVDNTPLIIDVQQTMADAAWRMFYHSTNRWQKFCMHKNDYTVEVPMNYFHFQVTEEKLFHVQNQKKDKGREENEHANNQSDLPRNRQLAIQTSPEHVGLETEFINSTGEKQTYNFKCEKTRKAVMNVTYQKGFSVGGRANFSLSLPKFLPNGTATTDIDMRVCVTKTTGETFEQTLTTCATSDITVAPHSHYTATVTMEELNLLADFKVWVMMSMPAKEARALIKNKQGETVFFYKLRKLSNLFPEENHLKDEKGETRPDAVEFVIEGRVDGTQLSSHRINLTDHNLVDQCKQKEKSTTGKSDAYL